MFLARSYSHYSLLSAVPKIEKLILKSKEKGYTTIALCDEDTTSGLVEFWETCQKHEVKPVLGSTLRMENVSLSKSIGSSRGFSKIALLAKNKAGYHRLLELVTIARTVLEKPNWHLNLESLDPQMASKYTKSSPQEDLKTDFNSSKKSQNTDSIPDNFLIICTNEHEFGEMARIDDWKGAEFILKTYLQNISNHSLLVELAIATSKETEEKIIKINQKIATLCDKYNVRYVASTAPRYCEPSDGEVFRTVLAIKKQVRLFEIELERDFSLPSFETLQKQYEYLPKAVDFEDLTSQIDIQIRTDYDKHAEEAFFPPFHLPEGQNSNQKLTLETYLGLLVRFGHILPPISPDNLTAELIANAATELTANLETDLPNLPNSNDENSSTNSSSTNSIQISPELQQKIPQIQEILKKEITTKKDWSEIFDYDDVETVKELARIILPDAQKLKSYKGDYWQTHTLDEYVTRIDYELDIIINKGYSSYFLVFADIMEFCRNSGIVTNTRGSAAGSMVGYLTNISVLDPIQFILPFERFLNPLRPSPPDIDGDFADNRRQDVIDYITKKYGYINVSQITTFGTMLPRAVVRDVGRVLGIGYKKCDQLSKIIPSAPQGRKTTFDWAFETSVELTQFYEKDEDVKRIIDIARHIEGNFRHASVHAAGVLITPSKLTDYCALQWDSDHKGLACQYDMKICEKVGLVKMDILGITNLSFLGESLLLVKKRRNLDIDLLNLDTEDLPTFDLLSKGRTMGIFQLSGPAMTKYLVQLEPTKVNDLMAMVALYRPGPMGSIPDYIARKKNPKKVTYPYPQMADWMKDSYGIFVYQEDLLYTAIELAGYNWGEVDVLRKGMGKKIQKVIDEQRPKFVEGCKKNGISEEKAEEIWALMVPFGAYGFNKSHSSSYGMVSFWTAFMKANFSAEFMTALMTSEMGNMEKTAAAIQECQEMGLIIATPDVNLSGADYEIEDDQTIRYGLSSIKNLGGDVIKFIISEREKGGKYKSLDDFLERMSQFQGFNKRSLEALISSGALDYLGQKELGKNKNKLKIGTLA